MNALQEAIQQQVDSPEKPMAKRHPVVLKIEHAVSPIDEHGRSWHPVTASFRGVAYSCRMQFDVVGDVVTWAFGDCKDDVFNALNEVCSYKGDKFLKDAVLQARVGVAKA